MNYIDGKNVDKEECQNIRKAVSKYGVTVVCDEADEAEKAKRDADKNGSRDARFHQNSARTHACKGWGDPC